MAEITLTINNRNYEITCDDGHEDHLRKLGAYVDGKVQELAGAVGQVGEPRLLVMASLLIADELHEAMAKVEKAGAAAANGHQAENGSDLSVLEAHEAEVAEALEACAQRLENIAANLGSS